MHYHVYFRFYRHEIRKLGGDELIVKFMKYMRDTNGNNINNNCDPWPFSQQNYFVNY